MYKPSPYVKLAVAEYAQCRIERIFVKSRLKQQIRFSDWRGGYFHKRALSVSEDELLILLADAIAARVFSRGFLTELRKVVTFGGNDDAVPEKWTHTKAFAHFGTKPANVQWSWSARNEDTKVVVCTLWQDQFSKGANGRMIYKRPGDWEASRKSPGFNELKDNLAWAMKHCEGEIRVIIAIAKDKLAAPRSILECFPSKVVLRLTYFDEKSGEFIAEAVE